MWRGETVAIFGTGPSLTQQQVDSVEHLPTIAINDAYRLAPWADMLYAADIKWWEMNPEAHKFPGMKVSCSYTMIWPEILCLRQTGTTGFEPKPDSVRTGGNSGYQAIHVAIHAKARKVLLFGFDFHGTHFFGRHEAPLRNTEPEQFLRWAPRFAELNGRGTEIVNCTPGSALDCFQRDATWAT
jgi:uncharacterized Rossmann fold enzyme